MRLGVVILPELCWESARSVWSRAEELGFEHAWTYDHLAWRSLRDSSWFAAIPTLTAAALVTERMRLGLLVASPNFRHPVPFAKELVALDDIAKGRLTVGLGAGSTTWDAAMLGQPAYTPRQRTERFEEFVHLLDLLLRHPAVSHQGTHFSADEARTYPGCVQQPRLPFAVAATGPRGMRLAAVHADTWVTTGDRSRPGIRGAADGAKEVRDQIDRLERACAEVGRNPASLDRLVLTGPLLDPGLASIDAFQETTGRYAEAGVTDLVLHWPRRGGPYAGDLASFERIVSAHQTHP